MKSENTYTSAKDPRCNVQTVKFIPVVEIWDMYKLNTNMYKPYIYRDASAYV